MNEATAIVARLDYWLGELESRRYTKGEKRLTTITKNGQKRDCCLGVVCQIERLHKTEIDFPEYDDLLNTAAEITYSINQDGNTGSSVTLPLSTTHRYGLGVRMSNFPGIISMCDAVDEISDVFDSGNIMNITEYESVQNALMGLNDNTVSWGFAVIPAIREIRAYWAARAKTGE